MLKGDVPFVLAAPSHYVTLVVVAVGNLRGLA